MTGPEEALPGATLRTELLQNVEFFGLGLDEDSRLPTVLSTATIHEVNAAAETLDPARATIVVAGPCQQA